MDFLEDAAVLPAVAQQGQHPLVVDAIHENHPADVVDQVSCETVIIQAENGRADVNHIAQVFIEQRDFAGHLLGNAINQGRNLLYLHFINSLIKI